ncbi:MAG: hypothetical protein J6Y25_02345 [Elusimicrobiaceae bacterium]|nr:hypothetical protein [Elusimicrobiaceae bacterium]MBP5616441.1 hypothetical protein [Elusimicrobiaceae bacterium]
MNWAETLIGNNMNAHPDCLGLYIGVNEIYVAQSAKKDGGTVLESLIRVPVNIPDRSKLKPLDLNESYFTMDYWLDALTKVTSKKSWSTNKVVVSLAPEFCLLRHFVISMPLKRKEWAEGVPTEARKYIHFPFEKATYAYYVYDFETAATKQHHLGVVFTLTTKLIISRLEKGLKTVGFDLVSVEPSSLSLGRAFIDNDKEAVGNTGRIYSFFGKDMASFVFLNGTVPLLERDMEIIGSIPAERRRLEIANSTEFIAKQLEKDPFEEAVITGYQIDPWVPVLEADAHKPVRRWDLREVFGIETKAVGEVAAIGASGKFFDTKMPDIDFTKGKRLSSYEFNASWMFWKITFVLIALMLLFLGKSYLGMLYANYQLKKKNIETGQTVEDFRGLDYTQIQTNLDNIKSQNDELTDVYVNSPLITPVLVAVARSVPSNIWLSKISYSAPFPAQRKGEGSLTLEGSISSGRDGGEDLTVGSRFKDSLARQSALRRLCRNANIRYSNIAGSSSSNKNQTQQKAGKETQFVLTCSNETKSGRH